MRAEYIYAASTQGRSLVTVTHRRHPQLLLLLVVRHLQNNRQHVGAQVLLLDPPGQGNQGLASGNPDLRLRVRQQLRERGQDDIEQALVARVCGSISLAGPVNADVRDAPKLVRGVLPHEHLLVLDQRLDQRQDELLRLVVALVCCHVCHHLDVHQPLQRDRRQAVPRDAVQVVEAVVEGQVLERRRGICKARNKRVSQKHNSPTRCAQSPQYGRKTPGQLSSDRPPP